MKKQKEKKVNILKEINNSVENEGSQTKIIQVTVNNNTIDSSQVQIMQTDHGAEMVPLPNSQIGVEKDVSRNNNALYATGVVDSAMIPGITQNITIESGRNMPFNATGSIGPGISQGHINLPGMIAQEQSNLNTLDGKPQK